MSGVSRRQWYATCIKVKSPVSVHTKNEFLLHILFLFNQMLAGGVINVVNLFVWSFC